MMEKIGEKPAEILKEKEAVSSEKKSEAPAEKKKEVEASDNKSSKTEKLEGLKKGDKKTVEEDKRLKE